MVLEQYNLMLAIRAEKEKEAAAQARARGDEREMSVCLMKESMLGEMLKALGRVEHEGIRPGILQAEIDELERRAAVQDEKQDFDQADRLRVQAGTVRWALNTLRKLEGKEDE